MTPPVFPCPYYQAGQTCRYREDCPIARYMPDKNCTELSQTAIQQVQAWLKDLMKK